MAAVSNFNCGDQEGVPFTRASATTVNETAEGDSKTNSFVSPKPLKAKVEHLKKSVRHSNAKLSQFGPSRTRDGSLVEGNDLPQGTDKSKLQLPIDLELDDFVVTESRLMSGEQLRYATRAL